MHCERCPLPSIQIKDQLRRKSDQNGNWMIGKAQDIASYCAIRHFVGSGRCARASIRSRPAREHPLP